MAIVRQNEDENQSQQNNTGDQQAQNSGGSRVSSFSSGSQAPAQSSGRFTNLKKYVDANKGSGEQLGNRITSGLEKETTKATDSSQAADIAKNVQAEKDRISQGDRYNERIQKDEARDIYGNETQKEEFSKLYNNANNVSNLTEQLNTAEQNQVNALTQAQGNVKNLGSEQGRFQLLQNTVKSPNYTTGQQRLDQLMLQAGNPQNLVEAQKNLGQQIKTGAQDLYGQYRASETGLSQASSEANRVANMLKGTVGGVTNDLVVAQGKKAETAQDQNALDRAALDRILRDSGTGASADDFTRMQDALNAGGLYGGMRTYNVLGGDNFNKYLDEGSKTIEGKDVISADDFARYEALRGLSGQGLTDFTQAGGGYTKAGLKGNLAGDIAGARTALENQLNRNEYRKQSSASDFSSGANFKNLLNFIETDDKSGLVKDVTFNSGNKDALTLTPIISAIMDQNPQGNIQSSSPGMKNYLSGNTGNIMTQNIPGDSYGGKFGANQLYQDFLSEIDKAGYNNTLGGGPVVTPPKK